jgi:hypothetical protein
MVVPVVVTRVNCRDTGGRDIREDTGVSALVSDAKAYCSWTAEVGVMSLEDDEASDDRRLGTETCE